MGLMFGDRLNRSWKVAKDSYAVLRSNPSLTLFPVISGIGTIIVSIPFIVALAMAGAASGFQGHGPHRFEPLHYAITGAMYFCTYFVVIFFNSALVACAHESLQGKQTSIGSGIDAAIKRLPQIIGWTLIASTVGLLLRFIGEQTGIFGRIATSLIGLAWNIGVFFVVPCLVIDHESPVAALKSSVTMLKQTWGERIILGIGVSSVIGLLALFALIPIGIAVALIASGMIALGVVVIVMAVLYFLVLAVVGSAINTIYQTALYLYSRNGTVPEGFSAESLQGAFASRKPSKIFGR